MLEPALRFTASAMKASIRVALAAALVAASPAAAQAQAPKPWKHGIIAPKADAGFLLMAAKRGFAEREGLKLELLEVKDDQIAFKALLAGELDSYEGGAQSAIAAGVRGADVKMMGCHWVVIPHGIMVRAGIATIDDLKGKSIAVSSPGSFPDMLARAPRSPSSRSTLAPCAWRRSAAIVIAIRRCSAAWSMPRWYRTNICRSPLRDR